MIMKLENKYIKLWFILAFAMFFNTISYATHNRAGEITYEQTGPLSIKMKLVTYTKASSSAADRDSVEILWGDGTKQWVRRSNGNGKILDNDVKLNEYIKDHTYPGRGRYTIFFTDPNRIANILNINFPNSVDIQFSLSTTFTLLDPQFQGVNNSVQLLQPPIDFACAKTKFIHNPNAFDPDGDSLSYELTVPTQSPNEVVPNYQFPDRILPGPDNTIQLNARTGEFIWTTPPQQGEYNIAIKINEYRSGVLINSVIRDMQILVRACTNDAPVVESISEICVIAGTKITIPISVNDKDRNQKVELTASGAPFILESPARLMNANGYQTPPYTSTFEWQTTCNHISDQAYKIVLRGVDNFFADTSGLATIKTILIKVVGPPPVLRSVVSEAPNVVTVRWDRPYRCETAKNDFLLGFSVWRSERSAQGPLDTCTTGIDRNIYQRLVFITKESDAVSYFYRDRDVVNGRVYCYRIVAEFARYTSSGNPFGIISSLASNEVCFSTNGAIPFVTKISVQTTNPTIGSILVNFTKPNDSALDKILNPPPYTIEILRRLGSSGAFTRIDQATKTTNDLASLRDTSYLDAGLNTNTSQYFYQVKLLSSGREVGVSAASSSVNLVTNPTQNAVRLTWSATTAWTNSKYRIYRQAPNSTVYTLLDSTNNVFYTDANLVDGARYCYYIESFGNYNLPTLASSLVNLSQTVCSTPFDNRPPCPSILNITNLCASLGTAGSNDLTNNLTWTDPNAGCSYFENVNSYRIYYATDSTKGLNRIGTVVGKDNRLFSYVDPVFGLQGCFYVTALDAIGNESFPSNKVCLENCTFYELPNTFTPNGDGSNDVFKPMKNFFVSKISMKVFNQWGTLIKEFTDPQINWDGLDTPDGTYYYVCQVFNRNLDGSESLNINTLSGYINIIR
jgi:gliding motility-associated-like protein